MNIIKADRDSFEGVEWVTKVEFEHQGKVFVCSLSSTGTPGVPGNARLGANARPVNAQWMYEVDGVQRGAGPAEQGHTPEDVAELVLAARLQEQAPD